MFIRAAELDVKIKVFHNASIMNAIGSCGLQLYNYGQTVSIPLFQGNWKPASFYDKIETNLKLGFHTLCLLDIKVKEPNLEILETRGKVVYDKPRYMTVKEACEQLLYIEEEVKKAGVLSRDTMCVAVSRLGQDDQQIVAATLGELLQVDMGAPLHSVSSSFPIYARMLIFDQMVIPGTMHELEETMLKFYSLK